MNSDEMMKKLTVARARFWVRVCVVGIIFSFTVFFILLDSFKEYKASVYVLAMPKNEVISTQSESIISNIVEFPKMLSFYERMLKFNPEINDKFAGKSKDERKKLWNEKLAVSTVNSEKGSVIMLTVYADSPTDADRLLKKTTTNLFEVTSIYYNAKNEIGMVVTDGPFVSAVSRNIFAIILASIFIGTFASFVLIYFLGYLENKSWPKKTKTDVSPEINLGNKIIDSHKEGSFKHSIEDEYSYDVPYDFENLEKNSDQEQGMFKPEISESDEYEFKSNPYPNYPEMPITEVKQASAPDNLPVVDFQKAIGDMRINQSQESSRKEEPTFIEMKNEEPTDKELRDRLNKLLKGGM